MLPASEGFFAATLFLPGPVSQAPFLRRGRNKSLMHCWPMFLHIEFNEIWNTSIIKNKSNNFAWDKTDLFLLRRANKKGEWWLPIKPAVHFSPSRSNKTLGKLFALYPTMTSFHNFPSPLINYLFTYSSDGELALLKLWVSINLTNSLYVPLFLYRIIRARSWEGEK